VIKFICLYFSRSFICFIPLLYWVLCFQIHWVFPNLSIWPFNDILYIQRSDLILNLYAFSKPDKSVYFMHSSYLYILCVKFKCCNDLCFTCYTINLWYSTRFKYQILRKLYSKYLSFLLLLRGTGTILSSVREITQIENVKCV